jgi:hypothetical protein
MPTRNWKWNCALAVPLLVAITTPAIGADSERFSIYDWRDDAGIQHYTNELADVPDADRNRVATLIKDWVPPEPPPQDAVSPTPDNTAQTTQASAAPVSAVPDVPQNNVTYNVDESQSSSVVQDTPLVTQQPVLFDDLLPAGGRASLGSDARPSPDTFRAAGPPPQDPAGPPPSGAAGPPPFGAAGRSPIGFAARRR